MLYMTPERFRIGGYGVDLTDVEDVELRAILNRATSMVNEYCTVPRGYDFRGGTVTGEQVPWSTGSPMLPSANRVFPRNTPLRSLQSMQLDVTPSQFAEFSEVEVYVTDNYFEVTSLALTSFGLVGAAILPSTGLMAPTVRLDYTYGQVLPEMGEVLEQTDAKLYRAMNQWWWDDPEPVVYVDGEAASASGYTLDLDEGTVRFADALDTDSVVSVDYAHRMPQAIAEATGMVAVDRLGDRNLTRKGLHGLVELAVGEVRIRRDFPRAGVQKVGVSDQVAQLLDPYKFITVRGGTDDF